VSQRSEAVRQWLLLVLWTACLVAFVAVLVGLLHPFDWKLQRPHTTLFTRPVAAAGPAASESVHGG
jgi:hypothetical protein